MSVAVDASAPTALGRWWAAATATPLRIATTAAVVLAVVQVGGSDDGPTLCVFRHATGGYCPGCGATRAARHLVHGQVGPAWRDHPWIVLAALQAVVAGLVVALARHLDRPLSWRRHLGAFALVNLVLVVAVWTLRLGAGSIPRFWA
jgi:hypothetical protein